MYPLEPGQTWQPQKIWFSEKYVILQTSGFGKKTLALPVLSYRQFTSFQPNIRIFNSNL